MEYELTHESLSAEREKRLREQKERAEKNDRPAAQRLAQVRRHSMQAHVMLLLQLQQTNWCSLCVCVLDMQHVAERQAALYLFICARTASISLQG